jgi:predicted glycoside hydrolase/deacetylase ChbG (UPF0249 family)
MNRVIHVHADDYGLGEEISNNIIDCINYGIVNSISIICNTKDFIDSIKIIKKSTNGVRMSLHINLMEGSPITDPSKVYMIINKDGEFRYSFITIWLKYILSTGKIGQLGFTSKLADNEIFSLLNYCRLNKSMCEN